MQHVKLNVAHDYEPVVHPGHYMQPLDADDDYLDDKEQSESEDEYDEEEYDGYEDEEMGGGHVTAT